MKRMTLIARIVATRILLQQEAVREKADQESHSVMMPPLSLPLSKYQAWIDSHLILGPVLVALVKVKALAGLDQTKVAAEAKTACIPSPNLASGGRVLTVVDRHSRPNLTSTELTSAQRR